MQGGDGAGDALVITSPTAMTPDPSPFGFRTVPKASGGKIWGPYLPPDTIRMGDPNSNEPSTPNHYVLFDRYSHPILYYPARKGANINLADTSALPPALNPPVAGWGGYLGPHGMFNPSDNDETVVTATGPTANVFAPVSPLPYAPPVSGDSSTGNMSTAMFMVLMGDVNRNGYIDGTEVPAFTGNYVLWSAGVDELFGEIHGLASPPASPSPKNPCDDVANFTR